MYIELYIYVYSSNSTELTVFANLINFFILKWGCFMISSPVVLIPIPNQLSKEYTVSVQGLLFAISSNIWQIKEKWPPERKLLCTKPNELAKTFNSFTHSLSCLPDIKQHEARFDQGPSKSWGELKGKKSSQIKVTLPYIWIKFRENKIFQLLKGRCCGRQGDE